MLRSSLLISRSGTVRHNIRSKLLLPALCTGSSTPGVSTMSKRNYKAVIFDAGGVIVPPPFQIFRDYELLKGLPPNSISRVIVEGGDTGSWHKLETGELSVTQFFDVFQQEYKEKSGGKVIDVAELFEGFQRELSKPYPQILDAIQSVKAEGLKTALLTNNWHWPGRDSSNTLPMSRGLFDVIVESCVVGMRKPDPRIFHLCLKQLGVAPEESIFLDDLGVNLKSAKALGIKTIKVNGPDQAVADLETELGMCLRCYVEGTSTVPKHLQIPLDRLRSYLDGPLGLQSTEPPVIRCFKHGQSNPTYYVNYGGKELVLRKKPPGKLLPSAHAVDREFRVMKALRQQGLPMPKMYGFCDDESLIGTPFYFMEYLHGRIFKNASLPGMSPAERRQTYSSMIDALCKIHSVDISAAGLDSFGKKGGYLLRNFNRWSKQYEASKTQEIESMNKTMDWLSKRMPTDERITVVHGDFRLDNVVYHPYAFDVIGILDWELSTIGDPLTDLVTCCLGYYTPPDFPIIESLGSMDLRGTGIPTVEEFIAEYCSKMGIPSIPNWDFYVVFSFFRMSAILQGVYKRAISGQGSAPDSKAAGLFARRMADEAWKIASNSKLQPTMVNTAGTGPTGTPGRRSYSTVAGPDGKTGQMVVTPEGLSPYAKDLYDRVKTFIKEEILPREPDFAKFSRTNAWKENPLKDILKAKAKAQGLWNLFMPLESDPDRKYGAGLTNLEYAFMCEEMGKCIYSSEVFNCSAPDTGNMETLIKYGTEEQKEQWLKPLLAGEIKSCFGMTEPKVASSDATNIESTIERKSDHYLLNGRKWWTSGAMHPKCKLCIFMGKTDKGAARHRQQSMILVPMDTPGITIVRPLSVFGYYDEPGGHAEVTFNNVKVPLGNILLGEGRGFEIAQGRLGPGRIHHCMRLIGNAERALELMIERTQNRVAFGKPLADQGTIQADIANSRIEIEQARLLVLKAAHMMDNYGNKVAAPEIAMIKVAAPNMALNVIDRAIQSFGGAGLSGDFPLAALFSWARVLRLADGPDEVHRKAVAKMEYFKHNLSKL